MMWGTDPYFLCEGQVAPDHWYMYACVYIVTQTGTQCKHTSISTLQRKVFISFLNLALLGAQHGMLLVWSIILRVDLMILNLECILSTFFLNWKRKLVYPLVRKSEALLLLCIYI